MSKLFISYRRKSWGFTHRLAEKLAEWLAGEIFVDVSGMDETNFQHALLRNLRESDAVLLIVSEYTFQRDRIHAEDDWVRREIREALTHDIPITMALIDGNVPPANLPEDIQAIRDVQGVKFYPEYFDAGVERLAEFLARATPLHLRGEGPAAPLPAAPVVESVPDTQPASPPAATAPPVRRQKKPPAPVVTAPVLNPRTILTFKGHQKRVNCVAFSPDGASIASGSGGYWTGGGDCSVRLWSASSGKQIARFNDHTDSVQSLAFSPDGKQLASGSQDETVRVWDLAAQEEVAKFTGHSDRIYGVAYHPDGQRLASGAWDKSVRLWNLATGQAITTLDAGAQVHCVTYSPDRKLLAAGMSSNKIRLWDATNHRFIRDLSGHSNTIEEVTFSPDGALLASASIDHTIRLWDARTYKSIAVLKGHRGSLAGGVESVDFSPDGKLLASGGSDKTVRVWEIADSKQIAVLEGHSDWVHSVAFSPDGTLVASASVDQTVRVWQLYD
jgi:dipeptidyl aminopeptidase/acylaminoacyl peptidase